MGPIVMQALTSTLNCPLVPPEALKPALAPMLITGILAQALPEIEMSNPLLKLIPAACPL